MEKEKIYHIYSKYSNKEGYEKIVNYLIDECGAVEVKGLPEDFSGILLYIPNLTFDEVYDIVEPYALIIKWYPNHIMTKKYEYINISGCIFKVKKRNDLEFKLTKNTLYLRTKDFLNKEIIDKKSIDLTDKWRIKEYLVRQVNGKEELRIVSIIFNGSWGMLRDLGYKMYKGKWYEITLIGTTRHVGIFIDKKNRLYLMEDCIGGVNYTRIRRNKWYKYNTDNVFELMS